MIYRILIAISLSASVQLAIGRASAGSLTEKTDFGSNPGRLQMFVYRPDVLADPLPLVVVMHGCGQTASEYLELSGWRNLADATGALLVLPQQRWGLWPFSIFPSFNRNHIDRCFNFADLRDSQRDQGEALSIRQMVGAAQDALPVDPAQIHVTGLSAGGGMAAVMLAVYPEVFAGGAIIAAPPYRCGTRTISAAEACGVTTALDFMPNSAPDETPQEWGDRVRAAVPDLAGPWPRVAIWQGEADETVDPSNARELIEQWTNVHGTDQVPDIEETRGVAEYRAYANAAGEIVVESWTLPGFGHATPIDPDGTSGLVCGFDGDENILDGDICSSWKIGEFFGLLP